jgi:hypothetical protein
VRSNWKTKNFNYEDNPLLEDSSSDEDYGEEYGEEDVDNTQLDNKGGETLNIDEIEDEDEETDRKES